LEMWCPTFTRWPLGTGHAANARRCESRAAHSAATARSAAFVAFSPVRFTDASPAFSASARRSHRVRISFQLVVGQMLEADKRIMRGTDANKFGPA
jgi:hypothetical protein